MRASGTLGYDDWDGVLSASGVALAETINCHNTPPCYGTPERDNITGTSSAETIEAVGGDHIVFAAQSDDTV
jgi:hypothetical protein